MFLWLALSVSAVVGAGLWLWMVGRRARRLLAHLPCLPPLPILGNAHQLLGDGAYFFHMLVKVTKIQEEVDLPFLAWVGPHPAVLVKDLDDIKAVTNAFVEKPFYYKFAKVWIGNGLVTAPTDIWKKNIKKLAGTFTIGIVEGYQGVFNHQSAQLVERMRRHAAGAPFDALDKYIAYTTLQAICQTALGESGAISSEYYKAFNRSLELLVNRFKNIFYHLDFTYKLSGDYKEMITCVTVMHRFAETIISRRKKEREDLKRNGLLPNGNVENGKTRFKSFLEILLELSEVDESLSERQIRDEVNTIIIGGQETAALTSNMALLLIGSNPDVQRKLYQETQGIFGDSKRPIEKEDLPRMQYFEAVINETLRMYPPVPCVMRESDKDLQLKSCLIPKGTGCAINIWGAGRSEKLWGADAAEFRPERWYEEGFPVTNAAGLFAFSYGKRACIGKRYAISLLKTILCYIVREFEVESDIKDLSFKADVSLKPCRGNLIKIRLREHK